MSRVFFGELTPFLNNALVLTVSEVLCGFPQFLQANSMTFFQIKPRQFNSIFFRVHPTIRPT
jgi:hypothetical protein